MKARITEPLILFCAPGRYDNEMFKRKDFFSSTESDEMYVALKRFLEKKGYRVATIDQYDMAEADHIVFIDAVINDPYFKEFKRRRKELKARASLVVIDAAVINYYQHTGAALKLFDRVLTWDPSRIDNRKFFPWHLPERFYAKDQFRIPYAKKKFICMVNGNKYSLFDGELYSERKKAAHYFEKTPEGVDVYGSWWNKRPSFLAVLAHAGYRWRFFFRQLVTLDLKPYVHLLQYLLNTHPLLPKTVKGRYEGSSAEMYAKYKFAVCFENARDVPGYATEKLFNCLNARCVPVYWGDDEILEYVPRSCYIDMRKFKDYAALYKYLKSIDRKRYEQYIKSINAFLKTANKGPYSIGAFVKNFYDGLIEN